MPPSPPLVPLFHSSEAFNKHSRTSLITHCTCFPITVHPFLSTACSYAKSRKCWPVSSSIPTLERAVILVSNLGLPILVLFRVSCYFLKASLFLPSPSIITENVTSQVHIPCAACFPHTPWTPPFRGLPSSLSLPWGNNTSISLSSSGL